MSKFSVRSYVIIACILTCWLISNPSGAFTLNQNCIISVLNRNAQANPDGTWVLPNIPANFGRVRARATCVDNGVTSYGQSDFFTIPPNGSVTLPPIQLGNTTPIPTSISLTAPTTTLNQPGQTIQLNVTATYPSGNTVDVTSSSTGTAYNISNPAIATVSPDGLVTALRSGTVIVQAINEGTQGILSLRVAFAGADSDGDGIPDEEEIRLGMNPNNSADALLDEDRDGLSALDEFQRGTDLRNPDTDGDGIRDGDEVRGLLGFVTNPLLPDTDGDGVWDRTEIQTGSDPTNANSLNLARALTRLNVSPTNFTLIVNSITGEASVQLTVTGVLVDGRTINLTNSLRGTRYSSSNLASCNFGFPDGRVFAGSAGACTITIHNNGYTATAQGMIQAFDPLALSHVDIPGFANDVAVSGDHAFVAAGDAGLQIVALSSDRRSPTIVASLPMSGNMYGITLAGNRAYVVGSTGLHVVDITNPLAPRLLGSFTTNGPAMGVRVVGSTAFLAVGSSLQIVNVANPAAMIGVSTLSVGGTAWDLDVDPMRNLAIVAAGTSGIRVIDISNLTAPVQRSHLSTGDARAVAMRGNYAFVADYNTSLRSVDITNPASPTIRSSTPLNLGGRLQDVALSGNFALGADVLFVNGVPIVDVSDPTDVRARTILNFTARDDNGMSIAVDSSYIYLAADRSGLNRGGASGNSRLYIGQFQPRMDLAGVAPTVQIQSPLNGAEVFEGEQITISVRADDDIAVTAVRFLIDGQVVFMSSSAPHQYTFQIPNGVGSLRISAEALDLGGNVGYAEDVHLIVRPDPMTVVTGRVVDANNTPIAGAIVTAPGGRMATSDAEGRYVITGVPTVLGNIFVHGSFTHADGTALTGSSPSYRPVRGGTTDVGVMMLFSAQFENEYGAFLSDCDDCFHARTIPFAFPYYGKNETLAYVSTNGYITFGEGDLTYTESVSAFSSMPRISAFFDDLYGRNTGAVFVNDRLPGRFVVTYDRVQHFSFGGSNTLQIQLFQDGRIVFAYKGITALDTGSITGITPGAGSAFVHVNYSEQRNITLPAGTAIYEYFTPTNLFDLDYGFVIFTPRPEGGYRVQTILSPPPAGSSLVTGGN